jgi:predicted ArsR family transcriptional regulator
VPDDFATRVDEIAALGEPVRRALYEWVVAQPGPVTRDETAAGAGVARHVAKFHLDKLVDAGLLEVDYRRPPGRGGPGAGRPAKRYRRASREVAVSLPERHYELAGRLLARAVTEAEREGRAVGPTLDAAARDAGAALGRQARGEAGPRPSRESLRAAAEQVLAASGYEPRHDPDGVVLVNCPFHALAREYTDLVCGMNLELLGGFVGELERANLESVLDPAPGRCCVRLRPTPAQDRARGGHDGAADEAHGSARDRAPDPQRADGRG